MVFVTLVKLVLMLYCRSFTNEIVKAYAQDHFFDVITNIIGLIAALLANYITDWIDPVGAMIVSSISLILFHQSGLERKGKSFNVAVNPLALTKVSGFKQFSLCCSLHCIPFELGQ